MEAAETGHLVFGTLHTRGAAHTLDRILDAFPVDEHPQIRTTLADNLRCVISQELVKAADGRGRCPALEIMVGTRAVSQLIRDGETFKIPGVIMTHRRLGMQLMDHSLLNLVKSGDIDPDEAFRLATSKKEFVPFVQHPDPAMLLAAGGQR
jgi:twitching motility protein PilT